MEKTTQLKKKAKTIMPIILGAVVVVGLIIGIHALYRSHQFASTDNAQIDADINPVTARAGGYIKSIRFTDNQYVHSGDTLIIIDDSDYRIRVEQAEAALEAARVNTNISQESANSSKTNIPTAESNINSAKVRLRKATEDYNRYKQLLDNQATTQEKLDNSKAEMDAAEAQLQTVQTQLAGVAKMAVVAEKQVGGAAATIRQRQADVDYARLQLSYTIVIAPVNGIVSKRAIQTGQLVLAGSPLLTIVNTDNMYVTANFKETQVRKLHVGANVNIKTDAYPDLSLTGRVVSFCGATGAKFSLLPPDNATGNFVKVVQRMPVRIALNLNDNSRAVLRPGMSVNADVSIR